MGACGREVIKAPLLFPSTDKNGAKRHGTGCPSETPGLDPAKVFVRSGVPEVGAVCGHCQPLGSISTKQQVFKTLVRETDNYNRIQSGKFIFFWLKVAKKREKKKKTNAAHVQDESSNSWKDSKGQRAHCAPWSRCWASLSPPRRAEGKRGTAGAGRAEEEHCVWAPDPDSGKGWKVLQIHKAEWGETEE